MQVKTVMTFAKPIAWIALGLVASVGFLPLLARPTSAQSTRINPLEDFKPQDGSRDIFSGSSNGQMGGMLDLIHRANMGNLRNSADFKADQQQGITDAAAQFRARQLELLRQPQPTTTPASPTP